MAHRIEPKIFLVAESKNIDSGLANYLDHIGAPDWATSSPSDVEEIVEVFGRSCYKSFGVGLNPNVTKVTEGNDKYIQKSLIESGHGSVLEHTWVSFMFCDVSRVFTHELCRHRAGTAISQESLRYVRLDDMGFMVPPPFNEDDESGSIFVKAFRDAEDRYGELLKRAAAIEKVEDFNKLPFTIKKKYTSAARRVAPIGLATNMGWSCNIRAARHILEMRTDAHAEYEIRLVFSSVGNVLRYRYPNLFADYTTTELPDGTLQFITKSRKV